MENQHFLWSANAWKNVSVIKLEMPNKSLVMGNSMKQSMDVDQKACLFKFSSWPAC